MDADVFINHFHQQMHVPVLMINYPFVTGELGQSVVQ